MRKRNIVRKRDRVRRRDRFKKKQRKKRDRYTEKAVTRARESKEHERLKEPFFFPK